MIKTPNFCSYLFCLSLGASFCFSSMEESRAVTPAEDERSFYTIQFHDIPVIEFIRFVGKISKENFIFNNEDLDFNITFSSGQAVPTENIVKALIRLLAIHQFKVVREDGCYVIHKGKSMLQEDELQSKIDASRLTASLQEELLLKPQVKRNLSIYKLQYHEGGEIVESLKKIAVDMSGQSNLSPQILQSIQTMQWVKATNSLLFSSEDETADEVKKIISSLDVPLRQVFIEVLVIETDVKKGMDFGLQWGAGGQLKDKVGFGMGNFASTSGSSFAAALEQVNANRPPTGMGQIPLVPGFDLGVIGDVITHRGRSYLSLGSLVSALQHDTDSTIVLNQKIITQDNKHSRIFVGDNIPFTGSVVQTVGQSQQTTANIEYRDVGVSLNITPMLGEGDIITLDLDEEISEAVDERSNGNVNGIRTTKTNMLTHVHVPDKHFLVLSGMIRNAKARYKTGIPILGDIPILGALFNKNKKQEEKRNIIIFVRPQIIHSFEEYKTITKNQEGVCQAQANPRDFSEALEILPDLQ